MTMEPSELKNFYSIDDEEHVIPYLEKHKELVSFLIEASKVLRNIFDRVQLKLEIKYDPEFISSPTLYCAIYTELSIDEALSKLDEFDVTWFLDNAPNSKGKVQFDVEWS